MGYFSNGSEGEYYFEEWCDKCAHMPEDPKDGSCPVWDLHLMSNYQECNKKDSYLHILIPRSKDGGNEKCTMFIERQKAEPEQCINGKFISVAEARKMAEKGAKP